MDDRSRLRLLPIGLLLVSCAAQPPVRSPAAFTRSATVSCDATVLNVVFISHADAEQRTRMQDSARRLGALFSSASFAQACSARAMNRTAGRSSLDVCRHVACAGPQDLKVGLFRDPDMPTLAFEKRGAMFFNAAKADAGTPANLAHEFAHVLGYTHATWWEWRREDSVPYALADVIESLDDAPDQAIGTGGSE